MKWSVILFSSIALLIVTSASAGRLLSTRDGRRISRLENTVRDLVRDVKEMKKRSSDSSTLAGTTLNALEVESKALSQFDEQMRGLQESLEQLAHRKDQSEDIRQSFRQELDHLKIELEEVKARNSSVETSTASENAAKSLQWLLKSVNEIRTELNQLNSNLNLSGTAQQAEEFNKQINLIQGEVLQLRHQWTAESVERQRLAAEIIEMRLDLNQSIENHQRCLKDLSQLTTEVQSLKGDWNVSAAVAGRSSSRHRPWNHHHQQKFDELKSALESVKEQQIQLETKMNRHFAARTPVQQKQLEQLVDSYDEIQSRVEVNSAVLTKIEASQGTLHQNVELVMEQSDFQAREILLALDRFQFNVTQVQVLCEQALQHQDIADDKLTRIASDVELMEGQMEKDRLSLMALQSRAMNETLQKCKEDTLEQIRNVEMQNLQYQMQTLQIQMEALNNKSRILLSLNSIEPETTTVDCGKDC